jgi:hypothetical protein
MKIVELNLGVRGRMVVEFTTTCAIATYHHLSFEFEPRSWRLDCSEFGNFVITLNHINQ